MSPVPDLSALSAFRIPSEATVLEALPYQSSMPSGATLVSHEDLSRDFSVVIYALSVLMPSNTAKRGSKPGYDWIVDCVSRLWSIATARKDAISGTTLSHSYEPLLKLLHLSVSNLSALRSQRVACLLASKLLSQVLGDILRESFRRIGEPPNPSLQVTMCWSIAHLFSSCSKVPELLQVYYEHLEHWVFETVKRPNVLQAYCHDFQVCPRSTAF